MVVLIWYIIGLAGYVYWWRRYNEWSALNKPYAKDWFLTGAFLMGFAGIFSWIFGYLTKDE